MKISLQRLNQLMEFLRKQLLKDSYEERTKLQNDSRMVAHEFSQELGKRLGTEQDDEAVIIQRCIENSKNHSWLLREKANLLEKIQVAVNQLIFFNLDIVFSYRAYQKQLTGCMEHSTLMFLALYQELINDNDVLIESIVMHIPNNPNTNHNFLVMNRNTKGDLKDVSSWGEDCLVIDTWRGVITSPSSMPVGSAVFNLLHVPGMYAIQLKYDNRFGLRDLNSYPESSIFHKVELISRDVLEQELNQIISEYAQKISFPEPNLPDLGGSFSGNSEHGFFAPSKEASPDLSVLSHDNLLSAVKKLVGAKQDFAPLMQAILNKNYGLALRRVCVVGHIELIKIILSFKEQLGFDINEPSKTGEKTALDWLEAASLDSNNKKAGIDLLVKTGAVRFSELSRNCAQP